MLEDTNTVLRRMWGEGVPISRIAEALGLTVGVVRYRSISFKLPKRKLTHPHATVWTPERDAELRRLWWDEGRTSQQVGDALGIKRGAVMGRLRLLKMPKRPQDSQAEKAKKGQMATRAARVAANLSRPNWNLPRADTPRKEAREPSPTAYKPLPNCEPVTLMDITESSCRWPIDSDEALLYCGQRRAGRAYCTSHHRLSLGRAA